MQKRLLLIAVLLLMPFVANRVSAKQFGCQAEYCDYNGTLEKWSCYYIGCPEQPDFQITQVINETTYNITDCSEQQIYDNLYEIFDDQKNAIDKRLNESLSIGTLQNQTVTYRNALNLCQERAKIFSTYQVNRSSLERCNAQLSNIQNQLSEAKTQQPQGISNNLMIGGLVIAGIYFLSKNDDEPDKEGYEENQDDDWRRDYSAIENEKVKTKLLAENEELKRQLKKKKEG